MKKILKTKIGSLIGISLLASMPLVALSCSDEARIVSFSYQDNSEEKYEGFVQDHDYFVVNGVQKGYAFDKFSADILSGYTPIEQNYWTYSKNNISLFFFDHTDFLANHSFAAKPESTYFSDFERSGTADKPTEYLKDSRYNDIKIMVQGDKAPVDYRWYSKTTGTEEKSGYYKNREDMTSGKDPFDLTALIYKYDLKSSYSSSHKIYYSAKSKEDAFKLLLEDNRINNFREITVNDENKSQDYWVFTEGPHDYFAKGWENATEKTTTMYRSKKVVQTKPQNLYSTVAVKGPTSAAAPALLNLFHATKIDNNNNFTTRMASIYKP